MNIIKYYYHGFMAWAYHQMLTYECNKVRKYLRSRGDYTRYSNEQIVEGLRQLRNTGE